MATTAKLYAGALRHLTNGDVNYLSDTIKAIVLDTYTPDQTHDTLADVLLAGTESVGSGYTARGQVLANKTITLNGLVVSFDADDISWTTANPGSLSGRYVVYYKDTGVDSTSYVLAYDDLGVTETATNGGAWNWAVPGVASITAA